MGAILLVLGTSLVALPAHADWHGWHHGWHRCWGCGPRFAFGFGFGGYPPPVYYAPPPVYYYPPPPVVYAPPPAVVYAPPPAGVQSGPRCSSGQWRQGDGSIVNGVACLQPNGTWQLQ